MRFKRLFLGLPLLAFFTSGGCNIVDEHSIKDGDGCRDVCEPYCEHFVSCGTITTAEDLVLCEDSCRRSYDEDPETTAKSCECVRRQACNVTDEARCGGPVVPVIVGAGAGGSRTGAGGSSTTVGAGGGGVGGAAGSSAGVDSGVSGSAGAANGGGGMSGLPEAGRCADDGDCALSEDCVAGTCLARCNASCECRSEEQCTMGHCRPSTSPRLACQRDCDCPASQHCSSGFCE